MKDILNLSREPVGVKFVKASENISCPASAAAFGLKPLPDMLYY